MLLVSSYNLYPSESELLDLPNRLCLVKRIPVVFGIHFCKADTKLVLLLENFRVFWNDGALCLGDSKDEIAIHVSSDLDLEASLEEPFLNFVSG